MSQSSKCRFQKPKKTNKQRNIVKPESTSARRTAESLSTPEIFRNQPLSHSKDKIPCVFGPRSAMQYLVFDDVSGSPWVAMLRNPTVAMLRRVVERSDSSHLAVGVLVRRNGRPSALVQARWTSRRPKTERLLADVVRTSETSRKSHSKI